MELQDIIALSRRYGSDPEAVLAGGGNTSAKDADRMYIKCSGVQLATMDGAGFVPIDRHKMDVSHGPKLSCGGRGPRGRLFAGGDGHPGPARGDPPAQRGGAPA